jgi:bifunctional non-homologous end joining protein LigD
VDRIAFAFSNLCSRSAINLLSNPPRPLVDIHIGAERGQGMPSVALLAREVEGALEYAGSAFITLKDAERERFWRYIDRLACDRPALPMAKGYAAAWCRPALRVSARHLKGGDKLRHATLSSML